MSAHHNFLEKAFCLVMNGKKMIGDDYGEGPGPVEIGGREGQDGAQLADRRCSVDDRQAATIDGLIRSPTGGRDEFIDCWRCDASEAARAVPRRGDHGVPRRSDRPHLQPAVAVARPAARGSRDPHQRGGIPLHAGIAFGAGMAIMLWLWANRDLGKCLLAMALTLMGWLAAVNTANDVMFGGRELRAVRHGRGRQSEPGGRWVDAGGTGRRRDRSRSHRLRRRHRRASHQAPRSLGPDRR